MVLQGRVKQKAFESAAQEAMVSLLVAAGHVEQQLQDLCSRHGITHDQYNVLRILRGVHPEGHPRKEITERLINRAPDVTRLIDRLEREGLVERARSREDRRLSIARITEKGLALLDTMAPEVEDAHEAFGRPLSEAELRELARLCSRVIP